MKKWLYIVIMMLAPTLIWASTDSLSVAERNAQMGFNDTIDRLADDFITASLVIADPGDVMYSILGHAALRMQCPTFNLDYVFSYESESVNGKIFRFLLNDLKMGMVAVSKDEYLKPFMEQGRGVREYYLNLPPAAEIDLWRILDQKVAEGMNLPYDYIQRGCATACRKLIDSVVEIQYAESTLGDLRTMREQFYDNAPNGWALFECMTLVGGVVDNPHLPALERLIAPCELVKAWQVATIDGQPVLEEPQELLPAPKVNNGDRFTPLYASLILLLLAIGSLFVTKNYIDWSILGIQTLFGCLILWLLIVPLPGTEWNWLIIPFNPLPIIFWKWRDKWAWPFAALMIVWCIGMLCAPHRLVEYAHIIFVLAFTAIVIKPKIQSLCLK